MDASLTSRMDPAATCPACGLPLPKGAAEGLCLRCLLEAGLQDMVTAETRTAGDGSEPLPDFGPYRTIGVLGEVPLDHRAGTDDRDVLYQRTFRSAHFR